MSDSCVEEVGLLVTGKQASGCENLPGRQQHPPFDLANLNSVVSLTTKEKIMYIPFPGRHFQFIKSSVKRNTVGRHIFLQSRSFMKSTSHHSLSEDSFYFNI